jgi:hypothetical protein
VDSTGYWYTVADALFKETQIYGAIEAISGTGNWPMTQTEFALWQDYFFMNLAEYCHNDEVISLEWPLIRHNKFREQLQFIGALKKVSRSNARRELIDQLIDSPISEKLFGTEVLSKVARNQERERLIHLFETIDEEETQEKAAPSTPLPITHSESEASIENRNETEKKDSPESTSEEIRLKPGEKVPAMAFASQKAEREAPRPEPLEQSKPVLKPNEPRKEEQEEAYKEAYQIYKEGKRYELAGNYLKALDSYYFCRQLLVQTPPARELYSDCMSAIARCTTKLEHQKRMAEVELEHSREEEPARKSLGFRLFWASLMILWISAVAYGIYVYYGDQLMPYVNQAIEYLTAAAERFL